MNHVSLGGEMDGVDAGACIQLENPTAVTKILFNMCIDLFSQILQNDVLPIRFVVTKRLLAEGLVYGARNGGRTIFD